MPQEEKTLIGLPTLTQQHPTYRGSVLSADTRLGKAMGLTIPLINAFVITAIAQRWSGLHTPDSSFCDLGSVRG